MKKILLVITTIAISFNLLAQPPMGGGRPGEGGRPLRGEFSQRDGEDNQIGITKLPAIEGLTDKQREKLVKELTNERKAVMKLEDQKHELMRPADGSESIKNEEKTRKKIDQLNEKINKEKTKSDQKIRTLLSSEQYAIFVEKRKEIEFRRPERRRGRSAEGERGNRPDREPMNIPMNNGFDNE